MDRCKSTAPAAQKLSSGLQGMGVGVQNNEDVRTLGHHCILSQTAPADDAGNCGGSPFVVVAGW